MKIYPILIFSVIFFMGCQAVRSQSPSRPPSPNDQPALKDLIPKRMVYVVPGMDRVRVLKDITYKRIENDALKMDVYLPFMAKSTSRLAAIVFIHGGPLPTDLPSQPKEWGVFTSYGQMAAARGFAAVTFNHRFFGPQRLLDAQGDIDDLITYIRDHASELGIDKDRIALWAFSGGGPFLSHALKNPPSFIRCIVAFYAIMDIRPLRSQTPSSISDDTLKDFSPVFALSQREGGLPPMMIGRGGLDNPVLNSTIDQFVELALRKNLLVDLCNHPNGHHGFDVRDDDDRSREIIRHAIEFIRDHT